MSSWRRTYWSVYAANLITAVGMMSFLPFFPSYLTELGVDDPRALSAWTGIVFGAAPLAAAVMGPLWGSIGDRYSRKLMVLRAMLAIALFVGLMSAVATPWQLLALRLGQGVFSGFLPPSITLVSVGAPRDVQGRISGGIQGALAFGSIIGPLFGALVQEHLGIRAVFLCVAGLALLGALLVALFASEERKLFEETQASWSPGVVVANAWSDLRAALRAPGVQSALVVMSLAQFGMGTTTPLVELLVRDVWRGDAALVPRMTGFTVTAFAGASLVAMPWWGRRGDRLGHGRVLATSTLLGGAVLGLHAAATVYAGVAAARVFLGLTLAGASTAAFGVVATETPEERRGSAIGAAFSARALAMSFGAMAGGALAGLVGLRDLFVASGVLVAAGLLLARWLVAGATKM